jgi:hypothetical protein
MTPLEKKRELMSAFASYDRWIREGKPKYREQQFYYDGYHTSVTPLDNGTHRISLQMSDSPEGDSWWTAEVEMLNGNTDVRILEEHWSRH